ncbi:hypothetical protein [Streptomyces griseus]|uniref:hypothetical protein n=1 Tax=Streptomyces griseus TaxID=1911 RepID=UPI00055D1A2F|nr:hypothetical protein [Streptomyces griseus]
MAFGAEELRVLRRALALALHPGPASPEDVQDCHRLAESLDEAMREGARLRDFLVADLARYRAALPGTAAGYLALLREVLGAGYQPVPEDLAALGALRGNPAAAALLAHCLRLADRDDPTHRAPRPRTPRQVARTPRQEAQPLCGSARPTPTVPASRTRLLALPGGRSGGPPRGAFADPRADLPEPAERPTPKPQKKPAEKPAAPRPAAPKPAPSEPAPARRPIPTPGEVFPRRKPTPPSADSPQQLAAG